MDHDRTMTRAEAQSQTRPRTHLFALRLWKVEVPGGSEYRGSVRDVASGAWRHFRDWSDVQAFVIEQVDEHEDDRTLAENGDLA